LIAAAQKLRAPLRAGTWRTLIGLLATTGLRIGEAIRLDRQDVDVVNQVLIIRQSKFGKSREVPLHATTAQALKAYACLRRLVGWWNSIRGLSSSGTSIARTRLGANRR